MDMGVMGNKQEVDVLLKTRKSLLMTENLIYSYNFVDLYCSIVCSTFIQEFIDLIYESYILNEGKYCDV